MTEQKDVEDKVTNQVIDIITKTLKPSSAVTVDSSFVDDLSADSLDLVELMMALEDNFNCQIPDEEASKLATVQDVVNYIIGALHKNDKKQESNNSNS